MFTGGMIWNLTHGHVAVCEIFDQKTDLNPWFQYPGFYVGAFGFASLPPTMSGSPFGALDW